MNTIYVQIVGIMSSKSRRKLLTTVRQKETFGKTFIDWSTIDDVPFSHFILFDYSNFSIPLGADFHFLISNSAIHFSQKISAKLKFVTQNFGLAYDEIPLGHKTACQIVFDSISYNLISSKIQICDSWDSPTTPFYLSNTGTDIPSNISRLVYD